MRIICGRCDDRNPSLGRVLGSCSICNEHVWVSVNLPKPAGERVVIICNHCNRPSTSAKLSPDSIQYLVERYREQGLDVTEKDIEAIWAALPVEDKEKFLLTLSASSSIILSPVALKQVVIFYKSQGIEVTEEEAKAVWDRISPADKEYIVALLQEKQ